MNNCKQGHDAFQEQIHIIADNLATHLCGAEIPHDTISELIQEAIQEGIKVDRSRIFDKLEEQKQSNTERLYNDLLFRIVSNEYESIVLNKIPNNNGDVFPKVEINISFDPEKPPEFAEADWQKQAWRYYVAKIPADEAWQKLYIENLFRGIDFREIRELFEKFMCYNRKKNVASK